MSSPDFVFDPEAAAKGDNLSSRIDSTGKYVGKFRNAWKHSYNERQYVKFEFESGGATAELTLYTTKEDGTRAFGYAFLQAIMAVLGLKSLTAQSGKARQWNADTRAWEEAPAATYPELCGRELGLLLQKRHYDSKKGDAYAIEIVAVFDAKTGQTSTERAANKPAVDIAKRLAGLKDKDDRKMRPAASVGDDIPF